MNWFGQSLTWLKVAEENLSIKSFSVLVRANQLRDAEMGRSLGSCSPQLHLAWHPICREQGRSEVAPPELEGSLVSDVIRTIYYQGPKAH